MRFVVTSFGHLKFLYENKPKKLNPLTDSDQSKQTADVEMILNYYFFVL